MTDLRDRKTQLRKTVLARRDAMDVETRIEGSLAAVEHGLLAPPFSDEHFVGDTIVSGFLPIRSEIDTRPLMAALAARGARLCLPVVLDKTTIQFRELVRGAPVVDTGFGTVGPDETAAVLDPEILLIPLSAFDRQGGRMGYGVGHYDRAIDRLLKKGIKPVLLGIAFSVQEIDSVPMEIHDKYLQGIITESSFIKVVD